MHQKVKKIIQFIIRYKIKIAIYILDQLTHKIPVQMTQYAKF